MKIRQGDKGSENALVFGDGELLGPIEWADDELNMVGEYEPVASSIMPVATPKKYGKVVITISNQELFEYFMTINNTIYVQVWTKVPGVVMPEYLFKEELVGLNVDIAYSDFRCDHRGIAQTMSFNKQHHNVEIPWAAITAMRPGPAPTEEEKEERDEKPNLKVVK